MTNNDNKEVYVSAYFLLKSMTNQIILKIINAGCRILYTRIFNTNISHKFILLQKLIS